MTDMEQTRKLIALLGLARRAGQLAMGASAVEKMVRRGERPLVILASDAGSALVHSVEHWTPLRGVVQGLVSGEDLAEALGRGKLSIVATTDPGFIRGIKKIQE